MIRIPKVPTFFKQMEEKMDRLKGKVILISGGARGQVRWTPKMRQLAKVEPCP
jgi:hypothetical protein